MAVYWAGFKGVPVTEMAKRGNCGQSISKQAIAQGFSQRFCISGGVFLVLLKVVSQNKRNWLGHHYRIGRV